MTDGDGGEGGDVSSKHAANIKLCKRKKFNTTRYRD